MTEDDRGVDIAHPTVVPGRSTDGDAGCDDAQTHASGSPHPTVVPARRAVVDE